MRSSDSAVTGSRAAACERSAKAVAASPARMYRSARLARSTRVSARSGTVKSAAKSSRNAGPVERSIDQAHYTKQPARLGLRDKLDQHEIGDAAAGGGDGFARSGSKCRSSG